MKKVQLSSIIFKCLHRFVNVLLVFAFWGRSEEVPRVFERFSELTFRFRDVDKRILFEKTRAHDQKTTN